MDDAAEVVVDEVPYSRIWSCHFSMTALLLHTETIFYVAHPPHHGLRILCGAVDRSFVGNSFLVENTQSQKIAAQFLTV